MPSFSSRQLSKLGESLKMAGWSAENITNLEQASVERLTEIRISLMKRSDIISAIEGGETELWLYNDQKRGLVAGRVILEHLTETGLLAQCADWEELKAIQAKRLSFYRKYFAGKAVVAWRGIRGNSVPYLFEFRGAVLYFERSLDTLYGVHDSALYRR